MHGKSHVSFAISACDNQQNFIVGFSTVVVVQWIRRWSSGHCVVQAEGSSPGGYIYQFFSTMIFITVLLGIMDFSDIVRLCNRQNSCYQQNLIWLKCFDMPLLSLGLFS